MVGKAHKSWYKRLRAPVVCSIELSGGRRRLSGRRVTVPTIQNVTWNARCRVTQAMNRLHSQSIRVASIGLAAGQRQEGCLHRFIQTERDARSLRQSVTAERSVARSCLPASRFIAGGGQLSTSASTSSQAATQQLPSVSSSRDRLYQSWPSTSLSQAHMLRDCSCTV